MDELARLAELIKAKNALDNIIAAQIGRAAEKGHVGEYIAARIFGIQLHKSASHRASDGCFVEGPCARRTVNIKWYAKHEGMIDLPANPGLTTLPQDYLVLTGPKAGLFRRMAPCARGQSPLSTSSMRRNLSANCKRRA